MGLNDPYRKRSRGDQPTTVQIKGLTRIIAVSVGCIGSRCRASRRVEFCLIAHRWSVGALTHMFHDLNQSYETDSSIANDSTINSTIVVLFIGWESMLLVLQQCVQWNLNESKMCDHNHNHNYNHNRPHLLLQLSSDCGILSIPALHINVFDRFNYHCERHEKALSANKCIYRSTKC